MFRSTESDQKTTALRRRFGGFQGTPVSLGTNSNEEADRQANTAHEGREGCKFASLWQIELEGSGGKIAAKQ